MGEKIRCFDCTIIAGGDARACPGGSISLSVETPAGQDLAQSRPSGRPRSVSFHALSAAPDRLISACHYHPRDGYQGLHANATRASARFMGGDNASAARGCAFAARWGEGLPANLGRGLTPEKLRPAGSIDSQTIRSAAGQDRLTGRRGQIRCSVQPRSAPLPHGRGSDNSLCGRRGQIRCFLESAVVRSVYSTSAAQRTPSHLAVVRGAAGTSAAVRSPSAASPNVPPLTR